MSDPIVFISRHDIKDGKLDELKETYRDGAEKLEAEKPGTVAFLAYLDEDETEVSTVHVFPDADAMDRHMEGVDERSTRAAEMLEFKAFEIYGAPSDRTMETMRAATESGAALDVTPRFSSGFLRLQSS